MTVTVEYNRKIALELSIINYRNASVCVGVGWKGGEIVGVGEA